MLDVSDRGDKVLDILYHEVSHSSSIYSEITGCSKYGKSDAVNRLPLSLYIADLIHGYSVQNAVRFIFALA